MRKPNATTMKIEEKVTTKSTTMIMTTMMMTTMMMATMIADACLQFVAHPHCQQLLASIWYEGIPGWRRRSFPTKVVIIISLICLLPLMALVYLLLPHSRLGSLVRTPFMKFMYHSASFGVFLFLLILASTNVGAGDGDQRARQQQRGPPPSTLEWLIVAYVMGTVSSSVYTI